MSEMSVRILNANPIFDVKEAMLVTIGKRPYASNMDGIQEYNYWIGLFIQKHSILRSIHIRVFLPECRADVARQLLRATKGHPQPYVQSGRPDWTGKPRPSDPDARVAFVQDFTPESFMALANQRLCNRAMGETRKTVMEIRQYMMKSSEPLLQALAFCSVPNCVAQCGCPEGRFNCHFFEKQLAVTENPLYSIESRYLDYDSLV